MRPSLLLITLLVTQVTFAQKITEIVHVNGDTQLGEVHDLGSENFVKCRITIKKIDYQFEPHELREFTTRTNIKYISDSILIDGKKRAVFFREVKGGSGELLYRLTEGEEAFYLKKEGSLQRLDIVELKEYLTNSVDCPNSLELLSQLKYTLKFVSRFLACSQGKNEVELSLRSSVGILQTFEHPVSNLTRDKRIAKFPGFYDEIFLEYAVALGVVQMFKESSIGGFINLGINYRSLEISEVLEGTTIEGTFRNESVVEYSGLGLEVPFGFIVRKSIGKKQIAANLGWMNQINLGNGSATNTRAFNGDVEVSSRNTFPTYQFGLTGGIDFKIPVTSGFTIMLNYSYIRIGYSENENQLSVNRIGVSIPLN